MEFQRECIKIDREFQHIAHKSEIQITVSLGWLKLTLHHHLFWNRMSYNATAPTSWTVDPRGRFRILSLMEAAQVVIPGIGHWIRSS